MKIKRLYLLLIFLFSILITNLHYSDSRPPLVDKNTTRNLIILADNLEKPSENLIPLDMSDTDHSFVVSDNYKDIVPIFLGLILSVLQLLRGSNRYILLKRVRGLYGIVFWDRKRIMLN